MTDAALFHIASQWFPSGTLFSSTNKTDCHDITELLLKVALNTITLTITLFHILTGYRHQVSLGCVIWQAFYRYKVNDVPPLIRPLTPEDTLKGLLYDNVHIAQG
jgi:hypothetical protein